MSMNQYRRFLMAFEDQLVDALMEGENMGWHHQETATPEYQHYLRLLTWIDMIRDRMRTYDATKVRSAWKQLRAIAPGAATGNVLGQLSDQHESERS